MKKITTHLLLFILLGLISAPVFSQIPNGISYQAVARGSSGNPIANKQISVQISIIDNSASGTAVYKENHVVTTSQFGLFSLTIGNGSAVLGSFPTIAWDKNIKFLNVAFDPAGGSAFINMGTQQLLAAPYSLITKEIALPYTKSNASTSDLIGITNTAGGAIAGVSTVTDASAYGIKGEMSSENSGSSSAGIFGINRGTSQYGAGVLGMNTGIGYGVYGFAPTGGGVYGVSSSGFGVIGSSTSNYGVYGNSTSSNGVFGLSSTSQGVYGQSASSFGVYGTSTSGIGTAGFSENNYGVNGRSETNYGVRGFSTNNIGVYGENNSIENNSGAIGVSGYSINGTGVSGYSKNSVGLRGEGKTGIIALSEYGNPNSIALEILGAIKVSGAPNTPAFSHQVAAGNIDFSYKHVTIIDHPFTNGDPKAILLVTPKYNSTYTTSHIGVWYNGSRWTIFHEDTSKPMVEGETFNVLVIKAE